MKIENRIFCVYVAVSLTLFIVVRQCESGADICICTETERE